MTSELFFRTQTGVESSGQGAWRAICRITDPDGTVSDYKGAWCDTEAEAEAHRADVRAIIEELARAGGLTVTEMPPS